MTIKKYAYSMHFIILLPKRQIMLKTGFVRPLFPWIPVGSFTALILKHNKSKLKKYKKNIKSTKTPKHIIYNTHQNTTKIITCAIDSFRRYSSVVRHTFGWLGNIKISFWINRQRREILFYIGEFTKNEHSYPKSVIKWFWCAYL